jgi:hypothetical protein
LRTSPTSASAGAGTTSTLAPDTGVRKPASSSTPVSRSAPLPATPPSTSTGPSGAAVPSDTSVGFTSAGLTSPGLSRVRVRRRRGDVDAHRLHDLDRPPVHEPRRVAQRRDRRDRERVELGVDPLRHLELARRTVDADHELHDDPPLRRRRQLAQRLGVRDLRPVQQDRFDQRPGILRPRHAEAGAAVSIAATRSRFAGVRTVGESMPMPRRSA